MGTLNYISSVVKILEKPKLKKNQDCAKNDIAVVKIRAQLPQTRNTSKQSLLTLVFHEDLSQAILNYFQPNDYIIIEGYLSVKKNQDFKLKSRRLKSIEVTVLKIYPFLLNLKVKTESKF